MAHVGLVGFEVDGLAAGHANDFAQLEVMIELVGESLLLSLDVSSRIQLIRYRGVGADQCHSRFVERVAQGRLFLKFRSDFRIAAKVVDMLQVAFGRLHWFTNDRQSLNGVIQPCLAVFQSILEQDFRTYLTDGVRDFRGVDGDGVFHFGEEVAVIDDVAEILVLTVEAIGATDGLEEAMILHSLVDIEVGAGWCVEACEQFVHHDQEFHVRWLLDEEFFRFLLVFGSRTFGFQQVRVGGVDELLVRLGVSTTFLGGDVSRDGIVGGY